MEIIIINTILLVAIILFAGYKINQNRKILLAIDVRQQERDAAIQRLSDIEKSIAEANESLTDALKDESRYRIDAEAAMSKLATIREAEASLVKSLAAEREEEVKLQIEKDLKVAREEMEAARKELDDLKQLVAAANAATLERAKQEDFIATHSLKLDDSAIDDIQLLSEIKDKFTKKDLVAKLIWSEFYQKPLQQLRKALSADKATGIYKITNTLTNQPYIGQAVDIGDRWTAHVKSAAGIGVPNYRMNKFYSGMSKEGIHNFTFEVLEQCSQENLDEKEKFWIDYFDSVTMGYNSRH